MDQTKMEAAQKACQSFLDKVQSNMPPPDPSKLEEERQKFLAFAQCMRDHGIDFPDPEINTDGGGLQVKVGGPGMNPDSPGFKEANDACATAGCDQFTYVTPPTVTSVNPPQGPAGGGPPPITVNGTGFFGGLTSPNVISVNFTTTSMPTRSSAGTSVTIPSRFWSLGPTLAATAARRRARGSPSAPGVPSWS